MAICAKASAHERGLERGELDTGASDGALRWLGKGRSESLQSLPAWDSLDTPVDLKVDGDGICIETECRW